VLQQHTGHPAALVGVLDEERDLGLSVTGPVVAGTATMASPIVAISATRASWSTVVKCRISRSVS
jgi:hypothetical protein